MNENKGLLYFRPYGKTRFAEAVIHYSDMRKALILQHAAELIGKQRVYLKIQSPALSEIGEGIVGNGTIEAQRIIVGDKECQRRLMVKDIDAHILLLAEGDVRRIRDDDVVSGIRRPILASVQDVLLEEVDRSAQRRRIPSGYRQGLVGDVYG